MGLKQKLYLGKLIKKYYPGINLTIDNEYIIFKDLVNPETNEKIEIISLSERELEYIALFMSEFMSREIASFFSTTEQEVEASVKDILDALEIKHNPKHFIYEIFYFMGDRRIYYHIYDKYDKSQILAEREIFSGIIMGKDIKKNIKSLPKLKPLKKNEYGFDLNKLIEDYMEEENIERFHFIKETIYSNYPFIKKLKYTNYLFDIFVRYYFIPKCEGKSTWIPYDLDILSDDIIVFSDDELEYRVEDGNDIYIPLEYLEILILFAAGIPNYKIARVLSLPEQDVDDIYNLNDVGINKILSGLCNACRLNIQSILRFLIVTKIIDNDMIKIVFDHYNNIDLYW